MVLVVTQAGAGAGGGAANLEGAKSSATGTLVLAHNAWVPWTGMASDYDSDGFWDNVGQQFVIPAGQAGKYLMTPSFEFSGDPAGVRIVQILINGASVLEYRNHSNFNDSVRDSITQIFEVAATDTVSILCRQNSGGSLNLTNYDFSISKQRT
jgi:hypothetical protein